MKNAAFEKQKGIPFKSTEKARAAGKKGGVASGVAKRKKKRGQELLRALLEARGHIAESSSEKISELFNIDKQDVETITLIYAAQIKKAIKGDTNAAKFCTEGAYGAPTQHVTYEGVGDGYDAIARALAGFDGEGEVGACDDTEDRSEPARKPKTS